MAAVKAVTRSYKKTFKDEIKEKMHIKKKNHITSLFISHRKKLLDLSLDN